MKTIEAYIRNDKVIVNPDTPTDIVLDRLPAYKNWDILRELGWVMCRLAGEPKQTMNIFDENQSTQPYLIFHLPENDLDKLEVEIATYDYYYQMSDDMRVWREGAQKDSRIKSLSERVGQEKYKELWNAYCPYDELKLS